MRTESVEHREIAPGLTVSRVVTGLWQVADMERDGRTLDLEATAAAMEPYAAAGCTAFDMADHYGSAEEIAGRFRRRYDSRDVRLLTKWVPEPGPAAREDVVAAVRRSLERLRMERLDLLQLHAWSYADPSWLDHLCWLQELREEGLVGHLGLTNFDTAHLRIVVHSGVEVVSNQVCFSLLDRRALHGMTAFCEAHGIHLLAFGTLAGGFLSERWLDRPEPAPGELGTWSRMKYKRFLDAAGGWDPFQELLRMLASVAGRHRVSIANVASRWVLDQPAVAGVIVGARLGESEHLDDNLRLFGFALDDGDRAAIDKAVAGLRPIPGDCGDEYRKPPFLTAAGDLSHHLDEIPPPYPVRTGGDGRRRVQSGTVWEDFAGYSRAVRDGDRILVSGTTATHRGRLVGGADPAAQTHFVIDKIEGAVQSLGGRLEDVVRTRVYVSRLSDWEAVARAHGERFAGIRPANTLVQAGLIGDQYLVEIEAEAISRARS